MAYVGIVPVRKNILSTIEYDLNPEKTAKDLEPLRKLEENLSSDEIFNIVFDYAVNPDKTQGEEQLFATGINCSFENAYEEFIEVQQAYGKTDGIRGHHGWQSFPPELDITADEAHEIGVELAKRAFGDRFQVVVTTHLDRKHLHNHFVINSVSFTDGKKYKGNWPTLKRARGISDEICAARGLPIIQGKAKYKINDKGIMRIDAHRSWREALMIDIDLTLEYATSFRQFVEEMSEKGYLFKNGKHFAISPPGMEKQGKRSYIRLKSLYNDDYSLAGIQRRIRHNAAVGVRMPSFVRRRKQLNYKPMRKLPYYKAVYYRYMYSLGLLKKRPKRISGVEMRKGQMLAASLSKQIQYIERSNISERSDLEKRGAFLVDEIKRLEGVRKILYNAKQRGGDNEEIARELMYINDELRPLREEYRIIGLIKKTDSSYHERLAPKESSENKVNNPGAVPNVENLKKEKGELLK